MKFQNSFIAGQSRMKSTSCPLLEYGIKSRPAYDAAVKMF
jgi:hypothetical protein